MDLLRTPDEHFDGLPGWEHEPRHATVAAEGHEVRMAYVDAGPQDAPPVLMLHGEPTWGYLYRKVIDRVTAAGLRAVVPDLVGFGRSDKPARREDYTYARHVAWTGAFLDALELDGVTLLCQDWGGLIGLRLVGEQPDRFAGVVAANTFLPTGDHPMPDAFMAWRQFAATSEDFVASRIVGAGTVADHPAGVLAAYDAPFPEPAFMEGARAFPQLVPISPDDPAAEANRRAWQGLARFERPFLTAFSDSDPITRGADRALQRAIPGAQGQPHVTLEGGGHFLQEDVGEALGDVVAGAVRRG